MRVAIRRMPSANVALVAGILLNATACDSPTEARVDYPCMTPAADLGIRRPAGSYWSPDDEFAALAREVPGGFGGKFTGVYRGRGEPDKVNFFLQDLSRTSEAIIALRGTEDRYHALQGEYNYLELKSCYDAKGPIWQVEQMISSDINEAMNRIVLMVTEASAEASVRAVLEASRIPQAMVLFEVGTRPVEAGTNR